MANTKFSTLSSAIIGATAKGGQRDYTVSFPTGLEPAEIISTLSTDLFVTSSDTARLVISAVAIGSDNRSVDFHVSSIGGPTTRTVQITIAWRGNSNSADSEIFDQPIVPTR